MVSSSGYINDFVCDCLFSLPDVCLKRNRQNTMFAFHVRANESSLMTRFVKYTCRVTRFRFVLPFTVASVREHHE